MSLEKDPLTIHRGEVLTEAKNRRAARAKLRGDVAEARVVLSPRYQFRKLVTRNKARANNVIAKANAKARAAAPAAGLVGVATAIFFARKPIARWISQLRNARKTKKTGPAKD